MADSVMSMSPDSGLKYSPSLMHDISQSSNI